MGRALDYEVWDVFTDRIFGGNQLAVIGDARGLEPGEMAAITREFNFSEASFVLPPETAEGTARVRIFTPAAEVPFAGHPTIGTAIALARAGEVFGGAVGDTLTLELGIGPIVCKVTGNGDAPEAAFVTDAPYRRLHEVPVATAAACLSLEPAAIGTDRHGPAIASKGLPFLLVELADARALSRAAPDTAAIRAAHAAHPPGTDFLAVYAYVRPARERIEARMFAPLSGIVEDPATGSAAAALAAHLSAVEAGPVAVEITQGVAMGRPSRIRAAAETTADGLSRVTVAGRAVPVMRGTLQLPAGG